MEHPVIETCEQEVGVAGEQFFAITSPVIKSTSVLQALLWLEWPQKIDHGLARVKKEAASMGEDVRQQCNFP